MRSKEEKNKLLVMILITFIYIITSIYIIIDFRIMYIFAFLIVNTVRKAFKARAAFRAGDVTMLFEGKMGLNPLNHISVPDIVIISALIFFNSPIIFGQGKNLEIKYRLFKNYRKGMLKVAFASLFSTFALMLLSGLIFKYKSIIISFVNHESELIFFVNFFKLLFTIFVVSASILLLNLLPLPGFDMFDMIYSYADDDLRRIFYIMSKYSIVILVILMYVILNTGIFRSIIFDLIGLIK